MTSNDFLESTKELLDLAGIEEYNTKLLILIGSIMSKLEKEGVSAPGSTGDDFYNQYQTALYYGVKLAFDEDVNTNLFQMLYTDCVENLRMSQL